MKKILIGIFVGIAIFVFGGNMVFADDICDLERDNPACDGRSDIFETGSGIIKIALALVGGMATIMIIIGGVTVATSAGDPGKVKKGKSMILYALIGLVVAVAGYAIVNFAIGAYSS